MTIALPWPGSGARKPRRPARTPVPRAGERTGEHAGDHTEERAGFGGGGRRSEDVTVYLAASLPEAHIVKNRLEAADIPCVLRYEAVVSVVALGYGMVEVRVPVALEDAARVLLDTDESDAET